ncbi:hypothetical protein NADE_002480 [Nannochloris sp. 'desiccata']|nr:hypothetical protein KSW81_005799 [Chlorella desiccata (nom. nud.)]KAH7623288.1 hypothetical protein NADE_002480 [Chlorella desiccata (nom. nud.)]
MAVIISGVNDRETRVVNKYAKVSAHSDENPFLVKVPGIQPLDAYADAYTIYAFQNKQGLGTDIVSDQLIHQKSWEQMSVFTHITQLDSFAREMNLDRSEVYFVDIGANLGTFSLGVAAAGFKVIAIEAMSVNQFALSMSLCANIGMSETVTLLSVALGKEAGQCTVFSARHNVLDGTIRCGEAGETELLHQGMVKRQIVNVARLDDLLEEWLPALQNRVGAFKMDTEGFEPWVIQGGKKFFSTVRPPFLQLEVSTMSDAATGISSTQMLEALAGLGYEIREHAFGRPVRARDLDQKTANNPGNVYLYAKANEKGASAEAIERLEFDKYAEEYKEFQKARLEKMNALKVPPGGF